MGFSTVASKFKEMFAALKVPPETHYRFLYKILRCLVSKISKSQTKTLDRPGTQSGFLCPHHRLTVTWHLDETMDLERKKELDLCSGTPGQA